jgi:hypothetical protein
MNKFVMGAALVAAVLLGSSSAMAKPKGKRAKVQATEESSGYGYDFPDDPMSALGAESIGPVIKVRKNSVRMTLIRPRAHFVPEMLKSVEQI